MSRKPAKAARVQLNLRVCKSIVFICDAGGVCGAARRHIATAIYLQFVFSYFACTLCAQFHHHVPIRRVTDPVAQFSDCR